jgi:predicted aspartyl protease
MSYTSLTVTHPGIARSIIVPVTVCQSPDAYKEFNTKIVEAEVYALIDTGCSTTSISDVLAARLGLACIGKTEVHSATGVHRTPVYSIDVLLKGMVRFTNIQALSYIKAGSHFDILLGMDALMLGDLAITNCGGQTVMSFRIPSDDHHIDFA